MGIEVKHINYVETVDGNRWVNRFEDECCFNYDDSFSTFILYCYITVLGNGCVQVDHFSMNGIDEKDVTDEMIKKPNERLILYPNEIRKISYKLGEEEIIKLK